MSTANDWAMRLLSLYEEGRSDIEVCKELGITKRQFNNYIAQSPGFRQLVEKGRDLAEAWWMEQSRGALRDRDFNTGLWNKHMQNRYGWTDKQDTRSANVNLEGDVAKLTEELKMKLNTILPLVSEEKKQALLEHIEVQEERGNDS